MNPNSSNQFLYLRAIQGYEGDNVVDPALRDNVRLPKGFTEYIYHVGSANELNSIIRNGLIPGGKVSFEEDKQYSWATSMRSYETKDRAILEDLETLSIYCMLVQFEARPRERSAILPDTVTCSRSLQHTVCSLH